MSNKISAEHATGTLTDRLPSDLARVSRKGLSAMESFLDLQADGDVAPANFERAYKFAKIGGKVVGDSIRFMGVLNKQAAISLQRDRMEARRMRASDDES